MRRPDAVLRARLRGASLSLRLSLSLAALVVAALGAVCAVIYVATAANLEARQQSELEEKASLVRHLVNEAEPLADATGLRMLLEDVGIGYAGMMLHVAVPGSAPMFVSPGWTIERAPRQRVMQTAMRWDPAPGDIIVAELRLDTRADDRLLAGLAATLLAAALAGAVVTAIASHALVRRGLAPIARLAAQLRRIRPGDGTLRLEAGARDRELQLFVERFETLLGEVDSAYAQLAAFNADVAHELRTPLAVLIADSEVMLSRPRTDAQWREASGRHLEDLRRLAAIVTDMLFLARADQASAARTTWVPSLASLVGEVVDYHEAAFEEQRLSVRVIGDAAGSVDAELLKRAVSNLLSNAARYGRPGSTVEIEVTREAGETLRLAVRNEGPDIAPEHLPRLFDRFYRAGASGEQTDGHHGLGLAIVAAIARRHGGRPFVRSARDCTEIGLELVDRPASAV